MASEFSKAVDDGLKLSKRLYFGKDADLIVPPRPAISMEKSGELSFLPTAPMVYAVIYDPGMVDNPDLASYQPHVYGKCDPPALIPLQMNAVDLTVNCYLDTVFVTLTGTWRVHCVMGSRSCDCRLAIPMGEQGSILGVEVDVPRKSYRTQLVETTQDAQKAIKVENGAFLKPHIFTVTIPQIDGGSNLSIKLTWSQKLLYRDGQFSVKVPFNFPEYVTPVVKKIPKKQKLQLNVNVGAGTEVLCRTVSHNLKEVRRHAGKLDFLHESNVLTWSKTDFSFSYTVSSNHIFGGVLLQSPSVHDVDQREMFCAYIFPGNDHWKVFRRDVVFVIDISGSMVGKLLEDTKNALYEALNKLDPGDSFNIIAFNTDTYLFSTSMELATKEAVERATQWIGINFISGGGTNILPSLTKAVDMLSNRRASLPSIILVTDGAVEDERQICKVMKSRLTNQDSLCPRLFTFGIGPYCNHYFLRMLAMIGRGHYDAAIDVDTISSRMQNVFTRASSAVLANITIDTWDDLDGGVEMYPSCIPDLSSESPLIISGRYQGDFPQTLEAKGVLADFNKFVVDLKIQKTKDIPLDRVCAKQQVDLLTAQAWYSEDKQLEEKVAKISAQTGVVSEYTSMFVIEMRQKNQAIEQPRKGVNKSEAKPAEPEPHKIILVPGLTIGFGNLTATAENIPPGSKESKLPEAAEMFVKAASNCCGKICGCCCCMCCIQSCTKMNNQCAILLTQIFTALAFIGCFECCSELCCCGNDG